MSNEVLYGLYRAFRFRIKATTLTHPSIRRPNVHISWPGREVKCDLWLYPIVRASYSLHQVRGAKSSSIVKLKELPQGILMTDLEPLSEPDNGPIYPTTIQQARTNMRKYESCVLLTRVGGFYEVRYYRKATRSQTKSHLDVF